MPNNSNNKKRKRVATSSSSSSSSSSDRTLSITDDQFPVYGNPSSSSSSKKSKQAKKKVVIELNNVQTPFEEVDCSSMEQLVDIIATSEHQFSLCGKRPSVGSKKEKDLLFVSLKYSFPAMGGSLYGKSQYVYCWIPSKFVKEFNDRFYRKHCSTVKFFINRQYESLKDVAIVKPSGNKSITVEKEHHSQFVDNEEIRSSRTAVLQQLTVPSSVPDGVELNKDEVLSLLKQEWMNTIPKKDFNYLVEKLDNGEKKIEFYFPFLNEKPPQIKNLSVSDTSSMKWLAAQFNNNKDNEIYRTYRKYFNVNSKNNPYINSFGCPTFKFWSEVYSTTLEPLIKWIGDKGNSSTLKKLMRMEEDKKKKKTDDAAIGNVKTNLTIFLNFINFAFSKPIPSSFWENITVNNVELWLDGLNNTSQLSYLNPNTKRFKIGFLWVILDYLKKHGDFHKLEVQQAHFKMHNMVNAAHEKSSRERDVMLKTLHSISYLKQIGQFISFPQWLKCIEICFNITDTWMSMYFDADLEEKKKNEIISKFGNQFADAMSFLLFHMSYFNRAEVYYGSNETCLRCFRVTPSKRNQREPLSEFTQFYFHFNGDEKIARFLDEKIWPVGCEYNALFAFYLYIFLPIWRREGNSLFTTVSGCSAKNAKGISDISKRVTENVTGISLGNRKCRLHYNGHAVNNLVLTKSQIKLLNSGMNHSQKIADKFYTFTNYLSMMNTDGNQLLQMMKDKVNKNGNNELLRVKINSMNVEQREIIEQAFKLLPELKCMMDEKDAKLKLLLGNEDSNQEEEMVGYDKLFECNDDIDFPPEVFAEFEGHVDEMYDEEDYEDYHEDCSMLIMKTSKRFR